MADETAPTGTYTLAALFEDTIDASRAIGGLRRAGHEPAGISLLVAVGNGEEDDDHGRRLLVSRAVADADIGDLGGWLAGLAALHVPDRGDFLGAGPLGAVLAALGLPGVVPDDVAHADAHDFEALLIDFGFSPDEAGYVASRLEAGAPLVAVTTGPGADAQEIRRILADNSAVYLGTAETSERFEATARALLEASPETMGGGVVEVADAVGPLRTAVAGAGLPRFAELHGRRVVDLHGEEVGSVDDALVECVDPDGPSGPEPERQTLRYLVVGMGGLLGVLGRKRVAVPAPLADWNDDPVRLRVEDPAVHAAPAYDDREPFSRRDEKAVNAYFGERPYWLDAATAAPAQRPPMPAAAEGEPPPPEPDDPPFGGLLPAVV